MIWQLTVSPHVVPEVLHDVVTQIVAHRVSVSRGSIHEALDTLRSDLTNRLGQLPAVLGDSAKNVGAGRL